MEMAKTATRQKFLYRCKNCGAKFIFYVDERIGVDKELDKKLWCTACVRQGGLIRGEKVEDK